MKYFDNVYAKVDELKQQVEDEKLLELNEQIVGLCVLPDGYTLMPHQAN